MTLKKTAVVLSCAAETVEVGVGAGARSSARWWGEPLTDAGACGDGPSSAARRLVAPSPGRSEGVHGDCGGAAGGGGQRQPPEERRCVGAGGGAGRVATGGMRRGGRRVRGVLRSCERIRHGEGARMRDGVRGITAGPVACKGRVAATVFC